MSMTWTLVCNVLRASVDKAAQQEENGSMAHRTNIYIFKNNIELLLVIRLYFGVPPLL
jgi:hypothetical protein